MALEEIRQLSGSHFDPHLAKEFMQMVEQRQPVPAPGKTGAVARTL
jgi:HD-GYP domain-containing protein (c-di-GMP phosphodiesterase class II)